MKRLHRAAAAVLTVCLLLAGCGGKTAATAEQTQAPTSAAETQPAFREDLTTLLVMGLDKYEHPGEQIGYTNNLQADFLLLVVMDREAEQCRMLQLNRDTMTEIRRLGVGGDVAGTFTGQLALAHTYGSGGSDSCLNAVKAVSNLLKGVKIDHYMAVTMDAVGTLNDLAGGVTVTVAEDMTALDPALEQGKEVTLRGDQALIYVQSRQGLEDSSNQARMERQRQYLEALIRQLLDQHSKKATFLGEALTEVAGGFASDCTVNQLNGLAEDLARCTMAPIRTLKGQTRMGERFVEFYPDEDHLMKTVEALFLEQKG